MRFKLIEDKQEQNYMNTINKLIKKKRKDKHALPYNNSFGPHNEKKDVGINEYNINQFNKGFVNSNVNNSSADGSNSVSVGEGLNDVYLTEDIESMKKYYPNIPDEDFQSYIELDPTYKGGNNAGKYAKWILGLANQNKLNNIGHIKDLLTRFDDEQNNLVNKDIMKYKSPEEVDDMLNDDNSYKELSHRQQVRQRQKDRKNVDLYKDAELVYENDDWEVWVPKTYPASCKLGQGTNWCTASTEDDYYYNKYKNEYGGDYYININKHNPKEKYQFHFESDQFMDVNDYSINVKKFLRQNPDLYYFYKKLFPNYITFDLETPKNNQKLWEKYFDGSRKSVRTICDLLDIEVDELTYAYIPNSVTHIGNEAFAYCNKLPSITIPNTVTSIGIYAFQDCTKLQSITIPDSVTSIGDFAFIYCYELASITIGNSVKDIGNTVFFGCTNLKNVYYSGTEEQWGVIKIGYDNEHLLKANIHFNSEITENYNNRRMNKMSNTMRFKLVEDINDTKVLYQKGNKKIIIDGYGFGIDDGINVNRFMIDNDDNPIFDYAPGKFWLNKVKSLIKTGVFDNKNYGRNKTVGDTFKYGHFGESCHKNKKHIKEDINSNTFKAYITNLGKYNEGELVGKWVEFPIDEDDFNEILKSIGISDEPDEEGNYYEEWFVTDYESPYGDPQDELGEYTSYDKLNDFGELIERANDVDGVDDVIEATGCSLEEAIDGLENGNYYFYPDINNESDLGYMVIEEVYGNDISTDLLERYFDYEALGRDLSFDNYENPDYDENDPDSEEYISAGEYWCGDDNASDEEIGEAFVDAVGFDGVSDADNYFDYESFGRSLTFKNFTLTSNGAVEEA